MYGVFGYARVPDYKDFLAKYMRQDIAARAIEAPSSAIWSNPPAITSTSEEWNTAWNNLIQRHKLFHVLNRLDILAGLGRYAVLYIGFSDTSIVQQPVRMRKTAPLDVLYLQPYAEPAAVIVKLVDDKFNDRYLQPEMYDLRPYLNQPAILGSPALQTAPFRVHASRCLHVAEGILEDGIIGRPRMERISNLLDDMLKVSGGTAETFWLTANRGMQADIEKDMDLSPEDEAALSSELEEYQNQLRRWIRTRGVKINSLGSDTPDPRGVFQLLLSLLSSATGIPQRVLTGAEAGQLASEQDRANWAERIIERRKLFAEPVVLWPLITMLTSAGVLPSSEGLKVTIEWPSAFRMSPLEEAQARAQQARSAVNLSRTLQESPDFITNDEARAFVGLQTASVTFDDKGDLEPIKTPSKGRKARSKTDFDQV
jgi:hypothetical protein